MLTEMLARSIHQERAREFHDPIVTARRLHLATIRSERKARAQREEEK